MTTTRIRKMTDFYRGDSVETEIIFKDDEGQYIDISNWKLFLTFKNTLCETDSEAPLQMLFTIPDKTLGKYVIYIPSEITERLGSGKKHWDLQLVIGEDPYKVVTTLGCGINYIKEDVTRTC